MRTNHRAARILAIVGTAIAVQSATGAILFWNNPAGGSAAVAGNWGPAQVPLPADILNFNLNATYPVTFGGAVTAATQVNMNAGVLSMQFANPLTVTQQFVVGLEFNSNATCNITSGTLNSQGILSVGTMGGTSVLTITSSASLVTCSSVNGIRAGNSGNGTVNLLNGAVLETTAGPVNIAALGGSQGAVNVSGGVPGTFSTLRATHATLGDILVGNTGTGALTVTAGGRATAADDLSVAPSASSVGTVTVGSATADVSSISCNDLLVAANVSAAAAGTGTLNIQGGGMVTAVNTTLGDAHGGTGTLNLSGGLLSTVTLTQVGGSGVLNLTGGEMRITPGGSLLATASLTINGLASSMPLVHVQGSVGTLQTGFNIGPVNTGTLRITGGGRVVIPVTGTSANLGTGVGSSGLLEISGLGSTLLIESTAATLRIAHSGSGRMNVLDRATVTGPSMVLGFAAGSSGTMRVEGGSTVNGRTLGVGRDGGGSGDAMVSGSSSINITALIVGPGSQLAVDDSVVTVASALGASAEVQGRVALANGAELAADTIAVSGVVSGSGNLYGDITVAPSGLIFASGGTLFAGSVNNASTGFVNEGTLDVNDAVVHILDHDGFSAGNIQIDGGHLVAARLRLSGNGNIEGHGGITGRVDAAGGSIAIRNGNLTFNGPVTDDGTGAWSVSSPQFGAILAAGGGFTGRGSIPVSVSSEEEAAIIATGPLSLGNNNTNGAVELFGPLHIGPHAVSLASNTAALLGVLTTIAGGTLYGPDSNQRTVVIGGPFGEDILFTVFDAVPLELPPFGLLRGHGTIQHKLRTSGNSMVQLEGALSIEGSHFSNTTFPGLPPDFSSFVRSPFHGDASVGPHVLELLNFDHRFEATSDVTVAGGVIRGVRLGFLGTLTGHGTIESIHESPLVGNGGTIRPGGAGMGRFDVVGRFRNSFNTGSTTSTAVPGTIEVQVSGDQGFFHDEIVVQGDAELGGTLTVTIVDAEPPIGQEYRILRCVGGATIGEFANVVLPTLASGRLHVQYTGGDVTVIVVPECRTDFNNDGFVEPGDLDEFITSFFSDNEEERSRCDFNGDGFIEPGDLDEFITSFFEGCD
ncbi:MAG: hypothetical protein ACT4PL_11110 [Phycisphaerales bacterium]